MQGIVPRAVEAAKNSRKTIFFLALIFLLAFGIRSHLMMYELFFEFDSYYHARLVSYILQTGALPERDPLAYWQLGGATMPATGLFFWYFNALAYKILTLGAPYNKDLWIFFVKILPALYGAIISVLMFFVGKEIYGKKAGYAMAFLAAVVPAFVYRTMAGFFEEDSFGFIWMIAGLVFFFKATKNPEFSRKNIGFALLSGILFGIMAWAWNMFILVPLILFAHLPFALLNLYAKRGKKEAIDFAKLFAITFAVFAVIATPANSTWIMIAVNYVLGVIPQGVPVYIIGIGLLLAAMLLYITYAIGKKSAQKNNSKTISLVSMLLMYGVIVLLATIFLVIPDYRGGGVLERTVGEESTGKESFGSKYNALIAFPIVALLLLPYSIYRKQDEHYSALIFFWIIITLFMAWYKLKFTYTFGLPIAAAAGFTAAELFSLQPRKSTASKAVALSLALMLLVGVGAAAVFVTRQPPNIETDLGWKQALNWMRENTPEDAKFFNWWDQGHWITFIGERNVFLDNRNMDYAGDRNFALFLIETDFKKSLEIIRKYNPDYIILDWDMLQGVVSFGIYAYNTTDVSHPEIQKYYAGPTVAFPCSVISENRQRFYQCGGNKLPEPQMDTIPSTWQEVPTQLVDNRTPLFVYTDKDKRVLYLINTVINQTTVVKIWFGHPETKPFFEEAYAADGVKIFKVIK